MEEKTSDANDGQSHFASNTETAEELLKSQTVGLVNLSDFRKRRAEVVEQKEREAHTRSLKPGSGTSTPSEAVSRARPPTKKRKTLAKGKLSFGLDDEEDEGTSNSVGTTPDTGLSRSTTPAQTTQDRDAVKPDDDAPAMRLRPNSAVGNAPKAMTKSSLMKDAQTREKLRKEFLLMQEAVKKSEILIPFVFYDGSNIPGGPCKVKKGDYIWYFLDKCRKIGLQSEGSKADQSKKTWARVGVDDLMLVREEIIIPHHFDFFHFIINDIQGYDGPLFDFSKDPSKKAVDFVRKDSDKHKPYDPLYKKVSNKDDDHNEHESSLEGAEHDPTITKVVDRRWYERNKHIYPASMWEEFDPAKQLKGSNRRDTQGNAFFFS